VQILPTAGDFAQTVKMPI